MSGICYMCARRECIGRDDARKQCDKYLVGDLLHIGEAMSMFDSQIKKLREKADILDGLEGMDNLVPMLREAADTIESMRDRLQAIQGVTVESNYYKLFGTPERAARTFADFCDACDKGECNDCPLDRLTDFCIGYDDLLEWLRGDA